MVATVPTRFLLALLLVAVAVGMFGVAGKAGDEQTGSPRGGDAVAGEMGAARLNVAILFLTGPILRANEREDARLRRLCGKARDVAACTERQRRSSPVHFVRLRTAPSLSASVAGDIFMANRTSDGGLTLVYRRAGDPRWKKWLSDFDSGYGPYLSGVRSRGGWIGLTGAPFDRDVWFFGGHDNNLWGEATSIAGRILELRDVAARGPDKRTRRLSGSYFVTRVGPAGEVTFREELPIDMPCGEDVAAPTVMPPTFRAPAGAFFDARDRPRFAIKYTRGC